MRKAIELSLSESDASPKKKSHPPKPKAMPAATDAAAADIPKVAPPAGARTPAGLTPATQLPPLPGTTAKVVGRPQAPKDASGAAETPSLQAAVEDERAEAGGDARRPPSSLPSAATSSLAVLSEYVVQSAHASWHRCCGLRNGQRAAQ